MMSSKGGFTRRLLAILLVVALPGCTRDLPTEAAVPAAPDAVLRIEAVSPTQLNGTVGEWVTPVPTVIVKNEKGQAIKGTKVIFIPLNRSSSAEAASLPNRTVVTDSRGFASLGDWKLGTVAGLHGFEARLVDPHYFRSDSGRVVVFRAEAKAAAAAVISRELSSGETAGLAGDELDAPVFQVTDRFGNDVAGVTLTFSVISGGGSLAKLQEVTSRFGRASPGKWTLGPHTGLNSFVAKGPGLSSITFNAQALDIGAVTWYDLVPQSSRFVVSGSIALGAHGTFMMVTVATPDEFPEAWPGRQFGTYTLNGTVIVLTFPEGERRGTLVDNHLSFEHTSLTGQNYPLEEWRFVKRQLP